MKIIQKLYRAFTHKLWKQNSMNKYFGSKHSARENSFRSKRRAWALHRRHLVPVPQSHPVTPLQRAVLQNTHSGFAKGARDF